MTTLVALSPAAWSASGCGSPSVPLAGWQLLPTRDTVAAAAGRLQSAVARFGLAGLVADGGAGGDPVAGRRRAGRARGGAGAAAARRQAGPAGAIDKTEAIASWAESVRDTMAAAAGLEEALAATAVAPPAAIAPQVRRLAERLRHQRLTDALAGVR
jgi:tight adherence protein B